MFGNILDKLSTAKAKDFNYIGRNLEKIREELVKKDESVTDKRLSIYSKKNVGLALGINYQSIVNIEQKGVISQGTLKLILFYYKLGYNVEWIILEDNEFINKKNIGDNLVYKDKIQKDFKKLHNQILEGLNEYKSKI